MKAKKHNNTDNKPWSHKTYLTYQMNANDDKNPNILLHFMGWSREIIGRSKCFVERDVQPAA
jgi:hypothetical protein